MAKRDEYLKKMHVALDRLQVKASLAKLELRDVRAELMRKYDRLREHMKDLGEATGERWDALKEACDAAWHSFKKRFDEVMAERRAQQGGGR